VTPAKASLLSFSPENRQYLHSAVMNALSEIAIKYNGKLVHRFEERFACYFPLTSDPKNEKAFQDAIECSIESENGAFITRLHASHKNSKSLLQNVRKL
jgi:hypothetical protein